MYINSEMMITLWAIAFSLTGNLIVGILVRGLREYFQIFRNPYTGLPKKDDYDRGTDLLGLIELIVYFLCALGGKLEFINWWLVVKIAGRWNQAGPPQEVDSASEFEPDEIKRIKKKRAGAALNIFLIGNLLNIIFGVIGGLIVKHAYFIGQYVCWK